MAADGSIRDRIFRGRGNTRSLIGHYGERGGGADRLIGFRRTVDQSGVDFQMKDVRDAVCSMFVLTAFVSLSTCTSPSPHNLPTRSELLKKRKQNGNETTETALQSEKKTMHAHTLTHIHTHTHTHTHSSMERNEVGEGNDGFRSDEFDLVIRWRFSFFLQRMRRMVAQLRSNSVPGRVEKKINN